MKKNWLIVLAVIVGIAAFAYAQSNITGSSVSFANNNGLACGTPTVGVDWICSTKTGWMQSVDGAPYTTMGATGPAGPAGAPGAAGPAGPQGIQGPAGTVSTSFTCSGFTTDATGIHFSGCK